MKRRFRKILMLVISLMLIGGISIISYAQTSSYYFDLDVAQSDLTKRTLKDGGSDYEARFYVTPTKFSSAQNYTVYAYRINSDETRTGVSNGGVVSCQLKDIPHIFSYLGMTYAPAGYYYYLQGYLVAGPTAHSLYVEGRYTP